jgi:hypothetical protein
MFLSSKRPTLALWPTQHPVQQAKEFSPQVESVVGVNLTTPIHVAQRLKMRRQAILHPIHVVMVSTATTLLFFFYLHCKYFSPLKGFANHSWDLNTEIPHVTQGNSLLFMQGRLLKPQGLEAPPIRMLWDSFLPHKTRDQNVKRKTNKPSSFMTSFENQNIRQFYDFTLQYAFTE